MHGLINGAESEVTIGHVIGGMYKARQSPRDESTFGEPMMLARTFKRLCARIALRRFERPSQQPKLEVAALMQVTQARVSTIERGELSRTELGTLQSYVEALGSRLHIVVDFGDDAVTIG